MGITLMLIPMDDPGITINGIWTMGDERTNEVWLDNVFVPDEYVVGEVNHGSATSPRRSTWSGSPCSPTRRSSSAWTC